MDEMVAMLSTAQITKLNQQLCPFIHFLEPSSPTPDQEQQQHESEFAAFKRELLEEMRTAQQSSLLAHKCELLKATQEQQQQWQQKHEELSKSLLPAGGVRMAPQVGSCGPPHPVDQALT
jgi:hypothetical protein